MMVVDVFRGGRGAAVKLDVGRSLVMMPASVVVDTASIGAFWSRLYLASELCVQTCR